MAEAAAVVNQAKPGWLDLVKGDQVKHYCQQFVFGNKRIFSQVNSSSRLGGVAGQGRANTFQLNPLNATPVPCYARLL